MHKLLLPFLPAVVLCERLIWSEEFDSLNFSTWTSTVSTYPQEAFHYTRNSRENFWVEDGVLNIKMTFTADTYGEEFLENGELDLFEEDPEHPCNIRWGEEENCYSRAGVDIVKPLQGANLKTEGSFSFRYGRVEARVKLPLTPWVHSALWLMPDHSPYGGWPAGGEIDIVEASGMRKYHCGGTDRSIDTLQSNLHFGPSRDQHWSDASLVHNKTHNYADEWHLWGMEWTENYIAFTFDGVESYRLTAPGQPGGLFDMAGFEGENIYSNGGALAPWDQKFFFIISQGTGSWPFYNWCEPPSPWGDDSVEKRREFWSRRAEWQADFFEQNFMFDYIRVYQ